MELTPLLREAIDAAKAIATAVCEIIQASAGIGAKDKDIPESAEPWNMSKMDSATVARLKQAVADFSRAAERLDEIDSSFLLHDIFAARRRFNAPSVGPLWGASDTGFNLSANPKGSAFGFVQTLVSITEMVLANRGTFLLDEDLPQSKIEPTELAFFCGTMTAFGIPAAYDAREIHRELEREAAAVQRLRDKHGTWNAIALAARPINDTVLSESEQTVLDYIRAKPYCTAKEIASATGLVQSSIERHFLPALKKRKLVRNRRGRGYYAVHSD
jgi:hypothetical protein